METIEALWIRLVDWVCVQWTWFQGLILTAQIGLIASVLSIATVSYQLITWPIRSKKNHKERENTRELYVVITETT